MKRGCGPRSIISWQSFEQRFIDNFRHQLFVLRNKFVRVTVVPGSSDCVAMIFTQFMEVAETQPSSRGHSAHPIGEVLFASFAWKIFWSATCRSFCSAFVLSMIFRVFLSESTQGDVWDASRTSLRNCPLSSTRLNRLYGARARSNTVSMS